MVVGGPVPEEGSVPLIATITRKGRSGGVIEMGASPFYGWR